MKSMPGHDVAGAEGDLLRLGEEVVGVAVQHHAADDAQRDDLLGDELGRVEHVEVEAVGLLLREGLQAEFPLGKVAAVDGLPKVAAVEIGVGAVDLQRLVPDHRLHAELRPPVELDEGGFALGVRPAGMCGCRSLPSSAGCAGWRGPT